ncbi:MAG: c-type cytochrome [Coriobacteriia bacterium]
MKRVSSSLGMLLLAALLSLTLAACSGGSSSGGSGGSGGSSGSGNGGSGSGSGNDSGAVAEVVQENCTSCHSIDLVTSSPNKTEAEWTATVKSMEAKGLEIDDATRTEIVDALVEQSSK